MKQITATVGSVNPGGPKGPYATAVSDEIEGTITFSLDPPVWQESIRPVSGMVVVLADIYMHRAGSENRGWRAMSARFFKPEDACCPKASELQT